MKEESYTTERNNNKKTRILLSEKQTTKKYILGRAFVSVQIHQTK